MVRIFLVKTKGGKMKYSERYREDRLAGFISPGHKLLYKALDEIIERLDRIENRTKPQSVVPPDAGPDDELDTSQFGD